MAGPLSPRQGCLPVSFSPCSDLAGTWVGGYWGWAFRLHAPLLFRDREAEAGRVGELWAEPGRAHVTQMRASLATVTLVPFLIPRALGGT